MRKQKKGQDCYLTYESTAAKNVSSDEYAKNEVDKSLLCEGSETFLLKKSVDETPKKIKRDTEQRMAQVVSKAKNNKGSQRGSQNLYRKEALAIEEEEKRLRTDIVAEHTMEWETMRSELVHNLEILRVRQLRRKEGTKLLHTLRSQHRNLVDKRKNLQRRLEQVVNSDTRVKEELQKAKINQKKLDDEQTKLQLRLQDLTDSSARKLHEIKNIQTHFRDLFTVGSTDVSRTKFDKMECCTNVSGCTSLSHSTLNSGQTSPADGSLEFHEDNYYTWKR